MKKNIGNVQTAIEVYIEILRICNENEDNICRLSNTELSKILKCARSTVMFYLRKLCDEGFIKSRTKHNCFTLGSGIHREITIIKKYDCPE